MDYIMSFLSNNHIYKISNNINKPPPMKHYRVKQNKIKKHYKHTNTNVIYRKHHTIKQPGFDVQRRY